MIQRKTEWGGTENTTWGTLPACAEKKRSLVASDYLTEVIKRL